MILYVFLVVRYLTLLPGGNLNYSSKYEFKRIKRRHRTIKVATVEVKTNDIMKPFHHSLFSELRKSSSVQINHRAKMNVQGGLGNMKLAPDELLGGEAETGK